MDGFTSLIVSDWFFGRTTVLIIGALGIYIANILMETRRRPCVVVRRGHRAKARGDDRAKARGDDRAKACGGC